MTKDSHYTLQVQINGLRPDFRVISVFLWGEDASYDSDGDSFNPASRTWTELQMRSRRMEESFEIIPIPADPLILEVNSSNEKTAYKVALFLARETNGQILNISSASNSENLVAEKLGGDFNWKAALERADNCNWRQSTLENPYPGGNYLPK